MASTHCGAWLTCWQDDRVPGTALHGCVPGTFRGYSEQLEATGVLARITLGVEERGFLGYGQVVRRLSQPGRPLWILPRRVSPSPLILPLHWRLPSMEVGSPPMEGCP